MGGVGKEVEGWTGEGSEGWRGQWGSLGSEAQRTGRKVVVWVFQSILAVTQRWIGEGLEAILAVLAAWLLI